MQKKSKATKAAVAKKKCKKRQTRQNQKKKLRQRTRSRGILKKMDRRTIDIGRFVLYKEKIFFFLVNLHKERANQSEKKKSKKEKMERSIIGIYRIKIKIIAGKEESEQLICIRNMVLVYKMKHIHPYTYLYRYYVHNKIRVCILLRGTGPKQAGPRAGQTAIVIFCK